jgi:hypothetical protein
MARRKTQRRHKQKQLRIDSMTGVNPKRVYGIGLWGNRRTVWSCRCDEKLAKAFNRVAIAKFGSICNPVECFMATVVGVYNAEQILGVNPSLTIDIGEIKIERNLRERRKMTKTATVETETETEETPVCGYVKCNKHAVARGLFRGKREYLLCEDHFAEAKVDRSNWSGLVVLK